MIWNTRLHLGEIGGAAHIIHAMALIVDHLNPAWVANARPGATSPKCQNRHPDHMVELEAPHIQAMADPAQGAVIVSGL